MRGLNLPVFKPRMGEEVYEIDTMVV